jgi:hypothetical protein
MDETDTTFDESAAERRRREAERPLGSSTLSGDPVGVPDPHGVRDSYGLDLSTTGTDDEIEALRRDISRLEGKVDALLEALEVDRGN